MSAEEYSRSQVGTGGNFVAQLRCDAFALLYAQLRAMALAQLRNERRDHTLSATALVNEVFVKLSGPDQGNSNTSIRFDHAHRGQFFAMAAVAMRRILVDYARRRGRYKRGRGIKLLDSAALANVPSPIGVRNLDTLELDRALALLASDHPDAARVVEMRFFAGLPEQTIADALGIHERTVRRHWTFAKAWLARELDGANEQ